MKNYDRIPTVFGKELKKLRQHTGLSQESLSEMAGVDKSYICLLEQGKRQPTLTVLYKLTDALHIPLPQLLVLLDREIPESEET